MSLPPSSIVRSIIILISGWTTVFMQQFVKVEGGGMSLTFVISVPLQIGLSLIFTIALFLIRKKTKEGFILNLFTAFTTCILIALALVQYPYK